MADPLRVAVVGAGYWGINHVRVLAGEPDAELVAVCDTDADALARAEQLAPGARQTASFGELLDDAEVEAVVIATPAASHAALAAQALERGKHVFVEKPIALSIRDAVGLDRHARERGLTLMVGHLMLYHPAVLRLRELLDAGELGQLYYIHASRVNLGRLRTDENALWSFAPHDFSIIDFLIGERPDTVCACGQSYLQPGIEDVVFVTLTFPDGRMAHVHLSWLDPHRERRITVVGSRKMVVFDDVASEKLRIYDKGYDRPPAFTQYDQYLTLRQGDVLIQHLDMIEPLAAECRHFVEHVRSGAPPRSGGDSAIRVVEILSAAQRSLDAGGAPMKVEHHEY